MRLINADALKEYFNMGGDISSCEGCTQNLRECYYKNDYALADFCNAIDDIPTVDALEVIRCKDCKWYYKTDLVTFCGATMSPTIPDGFCHHAQGKEH